MRNPESQAWRDAIPRQDTAPPPPPPTPRPEDWGVTIDEARAMLDRQMCPVCGEGPWKSPLNHVARKHGIDRLTMRDACHLSTSAKVTEAGFRAGCEERGRERVAGTLHAVESDERKARKPRRTNAAIAASRKALADYQAANPERMAELRAEFRDRMTSPEAHAKWVESVARANREREYSDEEKAAFVRWVNSPEAEAKRQAARDARRIDVCTVEGCGRKHRAKGYCSGHYKRFR